MRQLRVVQTGLDGQILNAQILIETMRVFKDRPIIGATLHLCNAKQPRSASENA